MRVLYIVQVIVNFLKHLSFLYGEKPTGALHTCKLHTYSPPALPHPHLQPPLLRQRAAELTPPTNPH